MHAWILVIGDDPIGQLTGDGKDWRRSESEAHHNCWLGGWSGPRPAHDWYGIGGRFTGMLMLKPGRSGVCYGDSMPRAEAEYFAAASKTGAAAGRCGMRSDRPGVDQARACDIDWDATLRIADIGALLAVFSSQGVRPAGQPRYPGLSFQVDAPDRVTVTDLMGQVPGDNLVTVVDAHR